MTISFVIPNWNRKDLLLAALASIRAQTLQPYEVLMVDNGSTDGSVAAAEQAGAKVLRLDRNRGFAFAVNRGLEAAQGKAIALVNNDVELRPDWTEKLCCALQRSGGWFATGKVLSHTRRDRIDGAGDAICRGGTSWRIGQNRPDGPPFDESRPTFFPSATAVLARREFFERAGPLDEAFVSYLEDIDLGLRAALRGLQGVYVPDAIAYHRGSATLGPWSAPAVRWLTRNQLLLIAKFYPAPLLRRHWRPLAVAQALWALLAIRHGRPLAYLRGIVAGLAESRQVRLAGSGWRSDGNKLASILAASEAELYRFQRASGWDTYWQWYFRLAPLPQETQR